jgi:predicted phage-related endonuclease
VSAPDISRDEWLALRRQSIGASEAAAACGEDPSVSPIELVCRKQGRIAEPDLGAIEAVQWGHLLEPAIVRETARRAQLELLPRAAIEALFASDSATELVGFVEGAQPFLRSRARPWQTATPDAIAFDEAAATHLGIEAKNAGQYHSGAWDTEEERAPEKFQVQVAHQLAVAPALGGGILAGLIGGNSLRHVRFERVRIIAIIDAVVALETRVWSCVTSGELPEISGPTASIARVLKALHPDDNGHSVVLDAPVAEIAARYMSARQQRLDLEKLEEALQVKIEAAIGSATFGVMPDGSGTFSLKTQERDEHITRACKFRQLRFSQPKAAKKTAKHRR